MKQPKIKSMKYEDFKDNEYLEQLRANGTDIMILPVSGLKSPGPVPGKRM